MLFGHLLKCRLVPKAQVHESLFKGANKRFKAIPQNKIQGNKLKKPLSEDQWAAKISKENQKRAKKADKLKALGYEFEAPTLKTAIASRGTESLEESKEEAPKAIEAAPEAKETKAGKKEKVVEESNEEVATPKAKAKAEKPATSKKAAPTPKKAASKAAATPKKAAATPRKAAATPKAAAAAKATPRTRKAKA
jgi:nucleolar protein 15